MQGSSSGATPDTRFSSVRNSLEMFFTPCYLVSVTCCNVVFRVLRWYIIGNETSTKSFGDHVQCLEMFSSSCFLYLLRNTFHIILCFLGNPPSRCQLPSRFSCHPSSVKFLLTMFWQQSQYDSRLGFSFRVLVLVRLGLG